MSVDEAFAQIASAIDAGCPANGYLLVGDLRGAAAELTERILLKLFPDAPEQIEKRIHPDVHAIAPEGRARLIRVDTVREGIVEPLESTSFCGGWRAAIIEGADRMNGNSGNALLKSLEEPPSRTMFILTSDQPGDILPTIVSRCQRVDLPPPENGLDYETLEEVRRLMREPGEGVYARSVAAAEMARIFGELKDGAEDCEVQLIRKDFFRALLEEARQWMRRERLPRYQAFRNIEAIEEAYAQSCRYLGDEQVLAFLMDRLTIPPK